MSFNPNPNYSNFEGSVDYFHQIRPTQVAESSQSIEDRTRKWYLTIAFASVLSILIVILFIVVVAVMPHEDEKFMMMYNEQLKRTWISVQYCMYDCHLMLNQTMYDSCSTSCVMSYFNQPY